MLYDTRTKKFVNEKDISEKELQAIISNNLYELFGLYLLTVEFPIQMSSGIGRIDILAMKPNGEIVVIELKQHSSRTIINQGIEYVANVPHNIKEIKKIAQSKYNVDVQEGNVSLICIAKQFSDKDRSLLENLMCNIHVFTYIYYDNDTIELDESVYSIEKLRRSDTTISVSALHIFLQHLEQYGIHIGNHNKYGHIFGFGLNVMKYCPQTNGPGKYGGLHKQKACIYDKELILIKVVETIDFLNKHDPTASHMLDSIVHDIHADFNESLKNPLHQSNFVLAPRQFKTKRGLYTAFSKDVLIERYPGFANINWL